MGILIISLLLLSHVLTDFYLQSDNRAEKKKGTEPHAVLIRRSLHFLACSGISTVPFYGVSLLPHLFILTILRSFIYWAGAFFERKEKKIISLLSFLFVQLAQTGLIACFLPFFEGIGFSAFFHALSGKLLVKYPFFDGVTVENASFGVLLAAAYLFVINGGNRLSVLVIRLPYPDHIMMPGYVAANVKAGEGGIPPGKGAIQPEKGGIQSEKEGIQTEKDMIQPEELSLAEMAAVAEPGRYVSVEEWALEKHARFGKVIGALERIIIVTAVLLGRYELIAVVVAVKSIARFKEHTDKPSDYYIIGTTASYAIAIFTGLGLCLLKSIIIKN